MGVDYVFYFIFLSILRNAKILYLDIYELLRYVFTGATVAIIAERLSRCTACVVSYGAVLTEATAARAASVDCWRLAREQT